MYGLVDKILGNGDFIFLRFTVFFIIAVSIGVAVLYFPMKFLVWVVGKVGGEEALARLYLVLRFTFYRNLFK